MTPVRLKFLVLALLLMAGVTAAPPPPWPLPPSQSLGAAPEPSREFAVKAAFLFNFVQFVNWPDDSFADASAPYVIAVVGADPFHGAIERVASGRTINGRALVVRHFERVDQVGHCHLLYVPRSENGRLGALMEHIGNRAILTVGEADSFCQAGGCVRFFVEENKIRFEINIEATKQARLKVSSKLLKLAKIYRR